MIPATDFPSRSRYLKGNIWQPIRLRWQDADHLVRFLKEGGLQPPTNILPIPYPNTPGLWLPLPQCHPPPPHPSPSIKFSPGQLRVTYRTLIRHYLWWDPETPTLSTKVSETLYAYTISSSDTPRLILHTPEWIPPPCRSYGGFSIFSAYQQSSGHTCILDMILLEYIPDLSVWKHNLHQGFRSLPLLRRLNPLCWEISQHSDLSHHSSPGHHIPHIGVHHTKNGVSGEVIHYCLGGNNSIEYPGYSIDYTW